MWDCRMHTLSLIHVIFLSYCLKEASYFIFSLQRHLEREAIAIGLEAIARRLEAIAIRLETWRESIDDLNYISWSRTPEPNQSK